MSDIFRKILEMSAVASITIIVVLLARLALSKAPKKYSYILWSAAAFRLVSPVSFRSDLSLFRVFERAWKAAEVIPADKSHISSGINMPVTPIESALPSVTVPPTMGDVAVSAAPEVSMMAIITVIWCIGIAVMLIFAAVSYAKTVKQFSDAVLLKDNIWQSDKVRSPVIVGLVRPRIYVPFGLGEDALHYALAHEYCHLRRMDHIIRPLAYLILAVHWFNPLCWPAYFIMISDMEMSCDEAVLAKDKDIGRAYSATLLSFAVNKRFPLPNPVDFGGADVKKRIKNILKWKKSGIFVSVAAIILCVAVVFACAANPIVETEEQENIEVVENAEVIENVDTVEPTVVPYSYTLPEYSGTTDLDAKIWEHMQMPESGVLQINEIPVLACCEHAVAEEWQVIVLDEEYDPYERYDFCITDTEGMFTAFNICGWEKIYDGIIDRYIDDIGTELYTADITYDITLAMDRLILQFITGTDVCGYKFIDDETGRTTEVGVARIPKGTAEDIYEFALGFAS